MSDAAASPEYERGWTDAVNQLGDLLAWGRPALGSNQGGGWFYESTQLGTAPITSERLRYLHDEEEERIYGHTR